MPFHARNTASTAIKSNTRLSQFIANEDITSGQILALGALDQHDYWKDWFVIVVIRLGSVDISFDAKPGKRSGLESKTHSDSIKRQAMVSLVDFVSFGIYTN